MKKNYLSCCTLTGVDDATLLVDISRLSQEFPIVEWGFLYSPSRKGMPGRYPSLQTMHDAFLNLPEQVRVALHVCGKGVPDLLSGRSRDVTELVDMVEARVGRIQLNFNQSREPIDLNTLSAFLDQHPGLEIITQHNDANQTVWNRLKGHKNYCVLFDSSAGRGILTSHWPQPLPEVTCGYAGGLGYHNLATELPRIAEAAGQRDFFWIDMEGHLRFKDEDGIDWFDIDRCRRVLEIVSGERDGR